MTVGLFGGGRGYHEARGRASVQEGERARPTVASRMSWHEMDAALKRIGYRGLVQNYVAEHNGRYTAGGRIRYDSEQGSLVVDMTFGRMQDNFNDLSAARSLRSVYLAHGIPCVIRADMESIVELRARATKIVDLARYLESQQSQGEAK